MYHLKNVSDKVSLTLIFKLKKQKKEKKNSMHNYPALKKLIGDTHTRHVTVRNRSGGKIS